MGKTLKEIIDEISEQLYDVVETTHSETINITAQEQTVPEDAELQTCPISWGEIEQGGTPGFENKFLSGTFPATKGVQATKTILIQGNEFGASRTLQHQYLIALHLSSVNEGITLNTSTVTVADGNGDAMAFGSGCWLYLKYTYDGSGGGTNPKISFTNTAESYKSITIDCAYLIDLTELYDGESIPAINGIIADYGALELVPGQDYQGAQGNVVTITSTDANGDPLDSATYPTDEEIEVVGGGGVSMSGDASPRITVEWVTSELVPKGSVTPAAENVEYDNEDSELDATDVQSAIDEVNETAKAAYDAATALPSGIPTAFERNRHRGSVLFSQAKYFYGGETRAALPQFLIVTDNHGTGQCVDNAVSIANGFPSIRGIFQLGDLLTSSWGDNAYVTGENGKGKFIGCNKPVFTVIGNHDVGNSTTKSLCATNAQLYAAFIKPMANLWTTQFTNNGTQVLNTFTKSDTVKGTTYTLKAWFDKHEEKKCYWYQDAVFGSGVEYGFKKYRIIGINEYDYPDDDSELYDGVSVFTDETETTYKFKKGDSYVSQAQAEWLVETLRSCPTDGIDAVIVLTHQLPFATDDVSTGKRSMKFCDNTVYNNFYTNQYVAQENGNPITGIVYAILNAFAARSQEQTVDVGTFSKGTPLPSYSVTFEFSDISSSVVLCPILAGHSHMDRIDVKGNLVAIRSTHSGKADKHGDIYAGKPITAQGVMQGYITDDSLNVVTFDPTNKMVKLCKLGADYSVDGYHRDDEQFNWETFATPVYGDKQVKEKIDDLE